MTTAELWDRRIERAEWLWATSEELSEVIDYDEAFALLWKLREQVVEDAEEVEWQIADRVLTFADKSRLLLIAGDANTAAGDSRVIYPSQSNETRCVLRDGSSYLHGMTRYSWRAFPPHDSF